MSKKELEETLTPELQFGPDGLLPAIVQDTLTNEILMLAYVNKEAFELTIETKFATFWSRSRGQIWKKGDTSGSLMKVKDILIDCDQDCIIFRVVQTDGGACHTINKSGEFRQSCFYRKLNFNSKTLEKIVD